MDKLIDVYVDSENKPQHLASPNELPEYAKAPTEKELYRPVCGGNADGFSVKKLPAQEVKCKCKDCADQLEMYLDVQE
jgi:hypothetical protein